MFFFPSSLPAAIEQSFLFPIARLVALNQSCLTLLTEEERPIDIWGQRHRRYLREYKNVTYTALLTSGKLNSYLADINEQAENMLYRLVTEMAAKENVTEQLKAENQILWGQLMNNIYNRAMEVVNNEIIYQ